VRISPDRGGRKTIIPSGFESARTSLRKAGLGPTRVVAEQLDSCSLPPDGEEAVAPRNSRARARAPRINGREKCQSWNGIEGRGETEILPRRAPDPPIHRDGWTGNTAPRKSSGVSRGGRRRARLSFSAAIPSSKPFPRSPGSRCPPRNPSPAQRPRPTPRAVHEELARGARSKAEFSRPTRWPLAEGYSDAQRAPGWRRKAPRRATRFDPPLAAGGRPGLRAVPALKVIRAEAVVANPRIPLMKTHTLETPPKGSNAPAAGTVRALRGTGGTPGLLIVLNGRRTTTFLRGRSPSPPPAPDEFFPWPARDRGDLRTKGPWPPRPSQLKQDLTKTKKTGQALRLGSVQPARLARKALLTKKPTTKNQPFVMALPLPSHFERYSQPLPSLPASLCHPSLPASENV